MSSETERLYELAKAGNWTLPKDLARCARYVKETSGWTFLHQAAYFGREDVVRALIAAGAALGCMSKAGETAADIAEKRAFNDLAGLMRAAAKSGEQLWSPSTDENLLPSSSAWAEARERRAAAEMNVGYGGARVVIPRGSRYFVDAFERVLVGWHGTYDPPCGMDGRSLVLRG